MRNRLEDLTTDTALSFAVPFVAYLLAELVHGSGVLAVVVADRIIGHRSPMILSGQARLLIKHNWRTIQFLLENIVFLLMGLQVRQIGEQVGNSELSGWVVTGICAAVLGATITSRVLWMAGIGSLKRVRRRLLSTTWARRP